MFGCLLIAFGCGSFMSCVPAFGGDQFKLPSEQKHLTAFFSYMFIATNVGSLFSYILVPTLRYDKVSEYEYNTLVLNELLLK